MASGSSEPFAADSLADDPSSSPRGMVYGARSHPGSPRQSPWRAPGSPSRSWPIVGTIDPPTPVACGERWPPEHHLSPQVHQVLPRLMRLMVALRVAFLGPFREECSFLFLVYGRGRTGMGLHHDGDVDSFWLQLEGRRTVTIGPPVARRTPPDLRHGPPAGDPDWTTCELRPGSLLYLPPRTPHEVVCHTRSLALSLTWSREIGHRGARRDRAAGLATWDVVPGHVCSIPRRSRDRLWTQIPALARPTPGSSPVLRAADSGRCAPVSSRRLAARQPARAHAEPPPARFDRFSDLVDADRRRDPGLAGLAAPNRPGRFSRPDGWNF